MLPSEHHDGIQVAFDDHRLVANVGLLLPTTLARRLGLSRLVDRHLDLGNAPGRANTGDKLMTLVASALAGGDCIDDADALRSGGTASVLGCVVKAPSTLGTFLRSFRWGHVRQLDRVSRELLAQAWKAGAGPGDGPLTIDLDSTICETYGLSKEGARHHGYTGQRGYHPLLAVAAGTGEVLMACLREGRANTARGADHLLRETVSRMRYAGAKGQITVRADSGFYTHGVVQVCRKQKVRFSITVRLRRNLRNLIEAIPERDWRPIPYWMEGKEPAGYRLNTGEAYDFLESQAATLQQAGFGVLLPTWWTRRGTRTRPGIRARAKTPAMQGGPGMTMTSLIDLVPFPARFVDTGRLPLTLDSCLRGND